MIMFNETAISEWLRYPDVPREFGLNRKLVGGIEDIKGKWVGIDEYASLFSMSQRAYHKYDLLALDIDGKTIEESYAPYTIAKEKLKNLATRFYFSGRGFWIFIDLSEEISTKEIYKLISRQLVNEYKLTDIVDTHVVGDVSRMARIPSSQNGKSGLYMVRLKGDETMAEILEMSKNNINYGGEIPKVKIDISFNKNEVISYDNGIITPVKWRGSYLSLIHI